MHRYSYRERDYAFGQRILTLRMQIGLTQTGLAELLHLTKRAVGEWEAGSAYPKMERLKALITLALQHGAFAAISFQRCGFLAYKDIAAIPVPECGGLKFQCPAE